MSETVVDHLRRVPLFASCGDKQLRFIATQVEEMDFPSGQVLCKQGTSGGEFFIMREGSADVDRNGQIIRRLGAGDFFGEIALLQQGPRTATVTATSPVRCLVLSRRQFTNVLAQDTSIVMTVLHAVAARLRESAELPSD